MAQHTRSITSDVRPAGEPGGVCVASGGDADRQAAAPAVKRVLVVAPQPFFSPRGTPFSVYYRTLVTAEQGVPEQLRNDRLTTSRMLIGLFEKLEEACLARADAVITICPELARYAKARMPDAGRHLLSSHSTARRRLI